METVKQPPARILIVDDEPDIAVILKLHLENAGYITGRAKDGETCLALMESEHFSLVLLDINLPKLSGVQVLERIKESGSNAAVIMMTGDGDENLAVKCMKAGAVDYFAKPFGLDDVLQRVEQALSYRAMLLEKQRLEQEKEDFVYMLSHDLKNPITAIIGSIDLVREGRLGPVNSEQIDYLEASIDCCNEVVAMINNMLDIHRIEVGRMQMHFRDSYPNIPIQNAIDRFTLIANREGISITSSVEENLPQVAIDRMAFSRVLANLLNNAIKFTPEGGQIKVTCHTAAPDDSTIKNMPAYAAALATELLKHKKILCISVKDTGNGIPLEDQASIFERFVQSWRSDREYGGAGLGLAYCKLTVENMGGIIWVESVPGQGSDFIFMLPCLEPKEEENAA